MDPKETLHRYLRREREDLLTKLDGLSERDLRWPVTRTGTNLLGLVKHTASVQADYFGLVFDRPTGIALPWMDDDAEVNADMWARAEESVEDVVALHHASAAHADATIEALDLDAPGHVPWWGDQGAVTLHRILVHSGIETARHAGHADIIREMLDGRAGDGRNPLPDQSEQDWVVYRARLEAVASGFSGGAQTTT